MSRRAGREIGSDDVLSRVCIKLSGGGRLLVLLPRCKLSLQAEEEIPFTADYIAL